MPTIYHEFTIKGNVQDVFDAITQPDKLECWWPQECQGKPVMGAAYRLYFDEPYDWHGEVVNLVPNKSFHVKMTEADPDWMPTTFGFDLTAEQDHVRVVFTHKDWAESNQHFRVASFCWAMLLKGLKDFVETGQIVPFALRS